MSDSIDSAAPQQTDREICANCGDPIGRLETANLYKGNVVCSPCLRRLMNPSAGVAAESPSLSYQTPSQYAPRVQTIERTSKKYKSQMLIAAGIMIAAMLGTCSGVFSLLDNLLGSGGGSAVGILIMAGAFVWLIVVRIGAWWENG